MHETLRRAHAADGRAGAIRRARPASRSPSSSPRARTSAQRDGNRRLSLHASRLQRSLRARRVARRGAVARADTAPARSSRCSGRRWTTSGVEQLLRPQGSRTRARRAARPCCPTGSPRALLEHARRGAVALAGRAAARRPPSRDRDAGALPAPLDRRRGLQEGGGDRWRREPRGGRSAYDGEPAPSGALSLRRDARRIRSHWRLQFSLGLGDRSRRGHRGGG